MERARGRPRKAPEALTAQLAIRLVDADRESLRFLAQAQGLSLSAYIVSVLKAHLDEKS